MKKYKITVEDNLPFPDETKTQQWTQVMSNPTSIAVLLITIDELEEYKKITIECIDS